MNLLHSVLILEFLVQSCIAQGIIGFDVSDLRDSFNDIIKGIDNKFPDTIPTSEEFLNLQKQSLFGYPEIVLVKAINDLCSLYFSSGTINPRITPNMDSMSFRLYSPCKRVSFSLSRPEKILQSSDFDINKKVAIYVSGWMTSSKRDFVDGLANAYNCRGDYNFLALNTSGSIDTLYTWSAYNTEEIGRQVAKSLLKLIEQVPVENMHLIGHSLGAQIVGSAGRYFYEYTGVKLPRITGLDPANPCFNEGESLSGLQRGDAEFVDVIHTNPGVLGKLEPVGDADFYAGGLFPIKPGCKQLGCSHMHAYDYFTETVYPGNEFNFLGVRCNSLTKLNRNFCNGPEYPMGFAVPHDIRGNYFLSVNAKKPYGQNSNGRQAVPSKCKQMCN